MYVFFLPLLLSLFHSPSCPPPSSVLASPAYHFLSVTTYKLTVKTGDVRGAGTDANVFVHLFGDSGDSGERKIESGGNNFERASADVFGMKSRGEEGSEGEEGEEGEEGDREVTLWFY